MMHRDFKNFDQEIFSRELRTTLLSEVVQDYNSFEENFLEVLNKHTPLKKKVLLANHAKCITKVLRKTTMKSHILKFLFRNKKQPNL